jgi:hypothetical protein
MLCNHTRLWVVTGDQQSSDLNAFLPCIRVHPYSSRSYNNAAAPCAAQHYPKSILPCSPSIAVVRKGQESVCISATGLRDSELVKGEIWITARVSCAMFLTGMMMRRLGASFVRK